MSNATKKLLSVVLSLLMIFSSISVAFAAGEAVTVKIVSFMRGEQSDLRSSELLEARVEGYEGNVRELTYKWKSTLGTYIYVYNSHNMYGINNTDGEIEIHNTDKSLSGLSNMVGRTYNKEFSGVGYAWASVYGAGLKASTSLVGVLTVEVYDENGNLLCSDSHEGKYTNRKNTGFVTYNLDKDMDNVVIGLFEGDKRNVLDLLGESAVVHITCVESFVDNGKIISGSDHIELTKESGDYYIKGTVAGTSTDTTGDAQVELDISKGNCKFHNESSGDAVTTVFVFKKPTTDTTTTTLTLTGNLDDRCDYFIGGVEGIKQSDGTILFTDLTPNTTYTVEVRGEYKDNEGNTKYAYAYVYDTTKPVYQATVYTYLDGVLTDIADIHGEDVNLYLHEDKVNTEYISLDRTDKGTYTAAVTNGIYYPWHIEAGDHYHQAREYKLIIENANGELSLHHYSVTYDTNGGAFKAGEEITKEVYSSMAAVYAAEKIPEREGYVFAGWESEGDTYSSGAEVTSSISAPIVLKAKWEKEVNVTINVTIDHKVDGGFDSNANKDELVIDFLEMKAGSPALVETGDKLYLSKDSQTDENGNDKAYAYTADVVGSVILETRYTATAPTYTGLLESSAFGVSFNKSGYDAVVDKTQDENGNWIINIDLKYNPDDFDLEFSVEMADDVPAELYPDAVIVKVACWNTEKNEWVIITQQRTTENTVRPGVRVDIDPVTGEGFGSYPVWKHDADNNPYGYRAVVTGFIYSDSTIVVPTEKDHVKDDNTVVVAYTDGNYTAIMGDVEDGKKYSTSLNGAYYDDVTDAQQGTLDGVITVEKYNVNFDAQGGTVNGKDTDIAEKQYYVPSFDGYEPVMEEHNFLGWYLDKECTIPAKEGELLTEDITLYAEWDRVLTGTLIVDGYLDSEHRVNDSDRATHALIELEEITPDGTYNIAGQTVEIDWSNNQHFSNPASYKFTGLDPDKTYRIDIYLMNYEAAYQNSTTVINGNGDIHDDYNSADYTAVYPENSRWETFVNTYLHFEPETYMQNVEVDASLIGEGFRPESALVEYFGKEIGTDKDYSVIIQHKAEPYGVVVGMDASTGKNDGSYGEEVWKKNFNGNLYDYQANLTKLGGKETAEWPVIAVYGDSVRWSPYNQAPTESLKVTLIPMWYDIIYMWNDGTDYSETVSRGHIWSYESAVDKEAPQRAGYSFGGWYSNPECTGEPVTKIDASVAQNTTVFAKWELIKDYSLTVKYVDKNNRENVLKTSVIENRCYGDEIKTEDLKEEFTGYKYDSASADSIIIDADREKNNVTLYYVAEAFGYTVNYLEKGTDKVLAEAKSGTAYYGDEITEAAISIEGYIIDGADSRTIIIDTDNNIINFYYSAKHCQYQIVYLEESTDKEIGKERVQLAYYGDTVTASSKLIDGYVLVDESVKSFVIDEESKVIVFYYATDKNGNGNVNGDGIPDKYQKKVIYKVVNGTWSNGKTADIVEYVTLLKDGRYDENGSGTLSRIPTGMKASEGFEGGSWKVTPPSTVSGMNEEIFEFIFEKTVVPPVDPEDPEDPEDPTPEDPEGDGENNGDGGNGSVNTETKHHIVFGKTDGIGWYRVSKDGGKTFETVFGNSVYEVEQGTELIIKVGDLMGDAFTFYVNGQAVEPDDDGNLTVTVNGYMLIGALGYKVVVPDAEESLNWFQKLIKAIKEFFAKLFGKA
ncbi:MAG: InlB B-repeat-containing protein [Clostridia bacterium]|nr:InlB B-repeat-containing protein [Clostridia bacterium]